MRTTFFMSIFLVLAFSLSACKDSAKIDELTKTNATLAAELQECRAAAKKASPQSEDNKKEAEAAARVKDDLKNMKKTPF